MPKSKRELAHLNVEALKLRHPENGMVKVNLSMATGDRDFIDRALEGQSARGGGLRAAFLAEAGVVLAAALMYHPNDEVTGDLWPNGVRPNMLVMFGRHLARIAKNPEHLALALDSIIHGIEATIREQMLKEQQRKERHQNGQNA